MNVNKAIVDEPVRILFVDDEQSVLKALQRMLVDDDFTVLTATSGQEGLEVLEREKEVQIVVSDFRMPGQNGVDFLREVRNRRPETVRIVLSGYADAGAIVAAVNEGQIYKFIPKPWNEDDLRVTLDNALERYFLHKQNARLMQELQGSNAKLQEINEKLEGLVEERTQKLKYQNQALQVSQNILDTLPVGVVGLDLDGTIVNANQVVSDQLGLHDQHFVGLSREEVFPESLNLLVERLADKSCCYGHLAMGSREYHCWITHMKYGVQEGVVVTLVPVGDRYHAAI